MKFKEKDIKKMGIALVVDSYLINSWCVNK